MNEQLKQYIDKYPEIFEATCQALEDAESRANCRKTEFQFTDMAKPGFQFLTETNQSALYVRVVPHQVHGVELPLTSVQENALADLLNSIDPQTYDYWYCIHGKVLRDDNGWVFTIGDQNYDIYRKRR